MFRSFIFICSGAGLLACSSVSVQYSAAERMNVNASYEQANRIDSLIQPYRAELMEEMEQVIAFAPKDFTKDRPNGTLNNWTADALLAQFRDAYPPDMPTFALLNNGGLRNPISQGDVTLGDLFKLMPFDNEVVVVELPAEVLDDLAAYFKKSGGESIAGAKLLEGIWKLSKVEADANSERIRVITSDYLMNGGDYMDFFQKKLEVKYTGVLLRDAFIKQAKHEKTLNWNDEERFRP